MEITFDRYIVRQEKKTFNAIYRVNDYGERKFITHRESWRQATNLAKLLHEAYEEGYEEAKDRFGTDMYG